MEGSWDAIEDLPVEERPLRAIVKGFVGEGGMYRCGMVDRRWLGRVFLEKALGVHLVCFGWTIMHVTWKTLVEFRDWSGLVYK